MVAAAIASAIAACPRAAVRGIQARSAAVPADLAATALAAAVHAAHPVCAVPVAAAAADEAVEEEAGAGSDWLALGGKA